MCYKIPTLEGEEDVGEVLKVERLQSCKVEPRELLETISLVALHGPCRETTMG